MAMAANSQYEVRRGASREPVGPPAGTGFAPPAANRVRGRMSGANGGDHSMEAHTGRIEFICALYLAQRPALLRFLHQRTHCIEEAEDLSQEVFIRLLKIDDVDRIRENARNFMFQVAANIARDSYRRAKVRQRDFHVPIAGHCLATDTLPPDRELEIENKADAVENVLKTLRERERNAFRLHVEKDLTYSEVAGEIGVTTRTIERWMTRIKKLIKSSQEENDFAVELG